MAKIIQFPVKRIYREKHRDSMVELGLICLNELPMPKLWQALKILNQLVVGPEIKIERGKLFVEKEARH